MQSNSRSQYSDSGPSGGNDEGFSELKDVIPAPFKVSEILKQYGLKDDHDEQETDQSQYNDKIRAMEQWSEATRAEFAFHLLLTCHMSAISSIIDRLSPLLKHDFVDELPKEIVLSIFSYLDPVSLVKCMQVSKRWNQLANEQSLWRELYEENGWTVAGDLAERGSASSGRQQLRSGPTTPARGLGNGNVRRAFSTASTKPKPYKLNMRMNSYSFGGMYNSRSSSALSKAVSWKDLFKNRQRLENNWADGNYFVSQLQGHSQTVYCLQCCDDIMVSGSKDCTIKIWSLAARTPNLTLRGHSASVLCLQYRQVPTLSFPLVVSGSSDSSILAWNARTGRPILRYSGHSESVLGMQLDDRVLVTCSKDRSIRIWRAPNGWDMDQELFYDDKGDESFYFEQPLESSVSSLASSGSFGPHSRSQSAFSYHTPGGLSLAPVPAVASLNRVPLDRSFILGDDNEGGGSSMGLGNPLKVLIGHRAAVNAIQFARGKIVSASGDRTLKIWDLGTGQLIRTLFGHETGIACVYYDGQRVISGSSDTTIKFWDPISGKCYGSIAGHTALVRTLQYDPTTYRLVSGSYDETIRIWDARMLSTVSGRLTDVNATAKPVLVLRVGDGEQRAVAARQDAVWRGRQARAAAAQTSGFFDINSLINQRVAMRQHSASFTEGSVLSRMVDLMGGAETLPFRSESITSNFQTSDGSPVTSTSTRLTFDGSASASSSASSTVTQHRPLPLPPPPLPPRNSLMGDVQELPTETSHATTPAVLAPAAGSSSNRVLKLCLDGGKIVSCSQSPHILLWDFTRSVQNAELFI